MYERILKRRHFALRNLAADVLEVFPLLLCAVLAPVREVHRLPSATHVGNRQPGSGSDVAVPRPDRLIGVAIAAGAVND